MKPYFVLFLLAISIISAGCATTITPVEATSTNKYHAHLQGVAMNENNEYFWSYTTTLVKTDDKGNVLAEAIVGSHHGDVVCYKDKLYCSFSECDDYSVGANAGSAKIRVFSQDDLRLLDQITISEANGIDGIALTPRGFVVAAEPIPAHKSVENFLFEYDHNFNLLAQYAIQTPPTSFGAQAITHAPDGYILTYYGNQLLRLNRDFEVIARYKYDSAFGIIADGDRGFASAYHLTEGRDNWSAALKLKKWEELTEVTLEELNAAR